MQKDSRQWERETQRRVKESDRTEEISSTEFPEGGNTIYTKAPGIPMGGGLPQISILKLLLIQGISNKESFIPLSNNIKSPLVQSNH